MKKKKLLLVTTLALSIFGLTNDARALTTTTNELPDKVVRKTGYVFEKSVGDSEDSSRIYRAVDSTGKYLLYCSDETNKIVSDDTLTKENRMEYGIAYILLNSHPTKSLISGIVASDSMNKANYCGNSADDMINIWITQQAIWGFQGTTTKTSFTSKDLKYSSTATPTGDESSCDIIKHNGTGLTGEMLWNNYVQKLIDQAKAVQDPANATITINSNGGWTKTDDGYKSDLISINSSNSEAKVTSYSLSISGAPQGIKVYTESGNDITSSLENITADTKVYIVVPEEIAKSGPKFTVNASANLTYNAAYKYVDLTTKHQPSVLVGPEVKQASAAISLTVVPDTASSIANSIYFVGFLILITGIGIIYANVKTKKEQV